jgi:hypothetical protein
MDLGAAVARASQTGPYIESPGDFGADLVCCGGTLFCWLDASQRPGCAKLTRPGHPAGDSQAGASAPLFSMLGL